MIQLRSLQEECLMSRKTESERFLHLIYWRRKIENATKGKKSGGRKCPKAVKHSVLMCKQVQN